MRTDVHRPSVIDPTEYRLAGEFYVGQSVDVHAAYASDHRALEEEFGEDFFTDLLGVPSGNFRTRGRCDHCGAAFAYGVAYVHEPSQVVIAVGHTCAANVMLPGADRLSRQVALRKRHAKALETERHNVAYRGTLLLSVPLLRAAFYDGTCDRNDFVADVRSRFEGPRPDLSERQVLAVVRSWQRDLEWETRRRAEEPEPSPVVEGRGVVVAGRVFSTRWVENDYGGCTKMLVLDDRGFKVWGTVPKGIRDAEKGDRVHFTANVEASQDDETFGFFKRPRKAEIHHTGAHHQTKEG